MLSDGPTDGTLAVLDLLLGLEDTSHSTDNSLVLGQGNHFPHIANTGRVIKSCFLFIFQELLS